MRSLYQCSRAKADYLQYVDSCLVYCSMGHYPLEYLGVTLTYEDLKNGDSLKCDTCTDCKDFSDMGETPRRKDRGW